MDLLEQDFFIIIYLFFYQESDWSLDPVIQRGCGVSILGENETPTGYDLGWHAVLAPKQFNIKTDGNG